MTRSRVGAAGQAVERLEQRTLFVAGPLDVSIGTGAARSVRFLDADGTAASISMTGGAATIRFAGDQLAQTPAGREVVVTGTNVSISSITANTSRRSALTISASGGDGVTSIGGITASGPMRRVVAPQTVLSGAVTIGGPVAQFDVQGADGAVITLGAGQGGSSINIRGAAANTTLTSAAPLRKVTLNTWGATGGAGGGLTAPSVGRLFTAGNFEGPFSAASAKSLDFSGLVNATINVTGDVGLLRARDGASDSVVNVGGSIGVAFFNVLQRSRVYSGVRPLPPGSPIPSSVDDFVDGTSIRRLVVGNTDSTFDSILAARSIRVLWMGLVRDLPPGGSTPNTVVVADRIRNFKGTLYNLRSQRPFRFKALDAEVHRFGGVEVRAI